MLRSILIYGTIGGLAAGAALSFVALTIGAETPSYGMAIGYLVMLIALSAIFVGIKQWRDVEQGGVIRFWPALGMGLGISVVAGILYMLCWEAVLQVEGVDSFIDAYAASELKGLSGEALAKASGEMASLKTSYHNPLFRLPMTFAEIFPVGLIVSLLSAALLRNPRFMPARAASGRPA